MSVCANSQLYTFDDSSQKASLSRQNYRYKQFSLEKQEHKRLKIPLISKRMNKIEQNIKLVTEEALEISQQKRQRYLLQYQTLEQKYKKAKEREKQKQFSQSIFISSFQPTVENHYLNSSCDRYEDIKHQDSIERFKTLNRMEEDYVGLKNKVRKDKIRLPKIIESCHGRLSKMDRQADVSLQDVEKSLKKTIIQQNGKKQFKDIHLIKKGRDKVSSSLMTVGQYKTGSSVPTYDYIVDQIKNSQNQLIKARQSTKRKILQDREEKKGKMMKNRHLNGNVYFNLVSLSTREKRNLRRNCRFQQNYGIE